jgi:hypothetical protein
MAYVVKVALALDRTYANASQADCFLQVLKLIFCKIPVCYECCMPHRFHLSFHRPNNI